MKKAGVLLLALLFVLPARAGGRLPQWREGWMDIHTIATGMGDATFLILPDGTSMLIDAGDTFGSRFISRALPDSTRTAGEWIARYILRQQAGKPDPARVDYFLLTHYHSDHLGAHTALRPGPHYQLAGVSRVAEQVRFGTIVDRDGPNYGYPSREAILKRCPSMSEYIKFVLWQRDHAGVRVEPFAVGSRSQFALRYGPKRYKGQFEVFNVAGNGRIADGRKTRALYDDHPEDWDENMFSCVTLFRYGRFTYYNGGDLGGSGRTKTYKTSRDAESQVADLTGHVTAMKADHHGWKDTVNPYFLWKTAPDVILFPCSHVNHPWSATVRRIADPQQRGRRQMFVTHDTGRQQVGEELWKLFPPHGHIVLRVYEGGTSYQVFVVDAEEEDGEILYQTEIIEL